jgi:N-acetylmuramoyl-L-alanine amidase
MDIYRLGSRGEGVRQIQKALKVMADGIFGTITEEAVKMFQATHGLTVDGIVGPATLARLIPVRLKKSKRHINEVIIHCTATKEGRDYTVDDIRKWHRERGWSDIGYHYVIYRDGQIAVGRDVDIAGAHCAGHNTFSIGVSYVGGCDENMKPKDTRTQEQKCAMLNLLVLMRATYPGIKIVGHNYYDKGKACPSFDANREYRRL